VHDESVRLAALLEPLKAERCALALLVGDIGIDPPWPAEERLRARGPHDASVGDILARVERTLGCPAVFVPGNHDLADPAPSGHGINADGRVARVAGLRIAGLGGAGPEAHGFPYEWTEDQAAASLRGLLDGGPEVDILLSHAPPADGPLDRIFSGRHVGSRAVGEWIDRARPRLFVCGHIHEAWGVALRQGVVCLNAGALGEPFGMEIAWTVRWLGGPSRIEALLGEPALGFERVVHYER